jgi:signal transduction protein with GAF and PtsI domain
MTSEDELTPAALLSTRLPAVATAEDEVQSALADRLARVVESAVEVLGVDSVGLMLLDQHDALRPAGFTGFAASAFEQVQIEIGEGPGIDASERAETIAVTDLAQAPCYARLWRRLANTGVRAVLASPVRVWGNVIGNLNAVRRQAHRWTETEIRANDAYAKVIGVTFDLAAQTVDAGRTHHPEPGLEAALSDPADRRTDG